MKTPMNLLFAWLLLAAVPALALDGSARNPACHLLLTEQECVSHAAALARLPAGESRDAYLLDHARLLQERERACACFRDASGKIRASVMRTPTARPATFLF